MSARCHRQIHHDGDFPAEHIRWVGNDEEGLPPPDLGEIEHERGVLPIRIFKALRSGLQP